MMSSIEAHFEFKWEDDEKKKNMTYIVNTLNEIHKQSHSTDGFRTYPTLPYKGIVHFPSFPCYWVFDSNSFLNDRLVLKYENDVSIEESPSKKRHRSLNICSESEEVDHLMWASEWIALLNICLFEPLGLNVKGSFNLKSDDDDSEDGIGYIFSHVYGITRYDDLEDSFIEGARRLNKKKRKIEKLKTEIKRLEDELKSCKNDKI